MKTISKNYKNKDYEYEWDKKANATRGNVYTIQRAQTNTSNTFQVNYQQQVWGKKIDKYANAQTIMCTECISNNVVAVEFSRRREHEPSTSKTFVRLLVLDYKSARQSS